LAGFSLRESRLEQKKPSQLRPERLVLSDIKSSRKLSKIVEERYLEGTAPFPRSRLIPALVSKLETKPIAQTSMLGRLLDSQHE